MNSSTPDGELLILDEVYRQIEDGRNYILFGIDDMRIGNPFESQEYADVIMYAVPFTSPWQLGVTKRFRTYRDDGFVLPAFHSGLSRHELRRACGLMHYRHPDVRRFAYRKEPQTWSITEPNWQFAFPVTVLPVSRDEADPCRIYSLSRSDMERILSGKAR